MRMSQRDIGSSRANNVLVRTREGRFFIFTTNKWDILDFISKDRFLWYRSSTVDSELVTLSCEVPACAHNEIDSQNISKELCSTDYINLWDDLKLWVGFEIQISDNSLGRTNKIIKISLEDSIAFFWGGSLIISFKSVEERLA